MASKYIPSVASEAARNNEIPNLPGVAGIIHRSDLDAVEIRNPATGIALPIPSSLKAVQTLRSRVAIADINAGATLLALIAGYKYRLVDAFAIAVGGAVGATTTVDILATQATAAVKLVAFGQAALTQSALVRAGSAGGVILADGASFAPNDIATAITVGKTGSDLTVATHVDFTLLYVLV